MFIAKKEQRAIDFLTAMKGHRQPGLSRVAINYGTVNICVIYVRLDSLNVGTAYCKASVVTRQQQNRRIQPWAIGIG